MTEAQQGETCNAKRTERQTFCLHTRFFRLFKGGLIMAINMEEFIKKNREKYAEYEASGITHDFVPYDAIKRVADTLVTIKVTPFDNSGVNYTVSWNGKSTVIGMQNRSDASPESYVAERLLRALEIMAREV